MRSKVCNEVEMKEIHGMDERASLICLLGSLCLFVLPLFFSDLESASLDQIHQKPLSAKRSVGLAARMKHTFD